MTRPRVYQHTVAIVGAGPAGIYAAQELAKHNIKVMLINRDIKPGGLAEYGIYFDKFKMKEGLRNRFRKILKNPLIKYFGNLTVGSNGDLTLTQLRALGFDAILVTIGAQGTKWLGVPGETLKGVYHAKEIVYHYNHLPPYSQTSYLIGKRVAIIGAGNVMVDIANYLINCIKVEEVIVIVRRDPSAVKFTKKEMKPLLKNLDRAALMAEIERLRPIMENFGIDPDKAFSQICPPRLIPLPTESSSRLRFKFLSSIQSFFGDEQSNLVGLVLGNNTLAQRDDGRLKVRRLGTRQVLEIDTAIFAIGDCVDPEFGLPRKGYGYAKSPSPQFPINDVSYEAYDPGSETTIEGVFIAGWAREASIGLVGTARKDGKNGALALLHYLESKHEKMSVDGDAIARKLYAIHNAVVSKEQWQRLGGFKRYQIKSTPISNIEMLQKIQLLAD